MVSRVIVRSPMRVTCPDCFGQLTMDENWLPPAGLSRNLRKYHHRAGEKRFLCPIAFYVETCLRDVPADVRRLAYHVTELQD